MIGLIQVPQSNPEQSGAIAKKLECQESKNMWVQLDQFKKYAGAIQGAIGLIQKICGCNSSHSGTIAKKLECQELKITVGPIVYAHLCGNKKLRMLMCAVGGC